MNPFNGGAETPCFEPASPLPAFSASALDALGNVCLPSPALTWAVEVHSEGIAPNPSYAAPDMSGISNVHGIQAARCARKGADGSCAVAVRVAAASQVPGLAAAVAAAADMAVGVEGTVGGGFSVLLAPSDAPMELLASKGSQDMLFDDVVTDKMSRRVFHVRLFSFLSGGLFTRGREQDWTCKNQPCTLQCMHQYMTRQLHCSSAMCKRVHVWRTLALRATMKRAGRHRQAAQRFRVALCAVGCARPARQCYQRRARLCCCLHSTCPRRCAFPGALSLLGLFIGVDNNSSLTAVGR
jgi:hypothetical protein